MHWIRRHPRGRPPHPDILTPAEWRVLEHVREGKSNADIASELGVSINTVRTHVSSMLAKLEVPDRQALAAWGGRPAASTERRFPLALPVGGWLSGKAVAVAGGVLAVIAVAVVAVVALPLALASDEETSGVTGLSRPVTGVFEELLAFVPDTPEARARARMTDHEAVRAFLDAEVPEGDFPELPELLDRWATFVMGERLEYFPGVGPLISGTEGPTRDYALDMMRILRDSIGLDLLDTDHWVMSGRAERELHAVAGPFDAVALQAALEVCGECVEPDISEHRGWAIHGWGDDFEEDYGDRLDAPFFDNLGRGGRLAFRDGYVLRAHYTRGIEAMVDAHAGVGSLADDPDYRLAARGLERLGALDAYLTDQPGALRNEIAAMANIDDFDLEPLLDAWTPRDGDVLLLPYSVIAVGTGWDGEPYAAVVLVHETPEAAAENARRLSDRLASARFAWMRALSDDGLPGDEARWSDVFEVMHVETDGRVVLARLRGPSARLMRGGGDLLWENIVGIEPLFQWEE